MDKEEEMTQEATARIAVKKSTEEKIDREAERMTREEGKEAATAVAAEAEEVRATEEGTTEAAKTRKNGDDDDRP